MAECEDNADLGQRYQREIMGPMRRTFETEGAKIERACELAAGAILAGGRCYCQSSMAHMVPDEIGDERVGRPVIFEPGDLENAEAGDFLLTSTANEVILALKERGVHVVGVQNPMLAEEYHRTLMERLDTVAAQSATARAAGKLLADRVCAGGKVYVYDRMRAVTIELYGRAGGLVVLRELTAEALSGLAPHDVVLFSSYRADDPRDLEVADKIAAAGAALVVVCPFEPEVPSGADLLKDRGDLALDTASGDQVGATEVPGIAVKVCPTSGITDVMAAYAVLGGFVTEMVSRGKPPNVYMAVHLEGAREYNRASKERFETTGY